MTTMTNNATIANTAPKAAPLTLTAVIASLFSVKLREKLDAETAGDKSDAAYHWGM
jgi:hypothetical protein